MARQHCKSLTTRHTKNTKGRFAPTKAGLRGALVFFAVEFLFLRCRATGDHPAREGRCFLAQNRASSTSSSEKLRIAQCHQRIHDMERRQRLT